MNSMIVLVATARLVAGARSTPTDGAAPRRRVGIATGAALAVAIPIGVSRVALGVHHPGDVVSGWVLAALWLTLTLGEARLPSEASPLAAGSALPTARTVKPASINVMPREIAAMPIHNTNRTTDRPG